MRMSRPRRAGFTLTELLVGSMLVMVLAAATYKVLTSNTRLMTAELGNASGNKQVIEAVNQLQQDLANVNPAWARQGVSVFAPHPGLSATGNIADSDVDFATATSHDDAITFLTTHPKKRQIFRVSSSFDLGPDTHNVDVSVYPSMTAGLDVGDLVLVYQSHQYALMRVSSLTPSGDSDAVAIAPNPKERSKVREVFGSWVAEASGGAVTTITLQPLPSSEYLKLRGSDVAHGYVVTQAGPAPCGGFDCGWANVLYDNDSNNDTATFLKDQAVVEPVVVTSYQARFLDVQNQPTTDMNASVVAKGLPQKWLVRRAWSNSSSSGPTNEEDTALLPVDNLRFSYDIRKAVDPKGNIVVNDLERGTRTDAVFQNAGLTYSPNATKDPFDLSLLFKTGPNTPSDPAAQILSDSYKIVALATQIRVSNPSNDTQKRLYEAKLSVANNLMKVSYQDPQMSVLVTTPLPVDADLTSAPDESTELTGGPAYIDYGNGAGDLIVPFSVFKFEDDGKAADTLVPAPISHTESGLFVYNQDGYLANGTLGASRLSFNTTSNSNLRMNNAFYPTSITLGPGAPPHEMWISGYAVTYRASDQYIHPAIAFVRWKTGYTFRQAVAELAGRGCQPPTGNYYNEPPQQYRNQLAETDCIINFHFASYPHLDNTVAGSVVDTSAGVMYYRDYLYFAPLVKGGIWPNSAGPQDHRLKIARVCLDRTSKDTSGEVDWFCWGENDASYYVTLLDTGHDATGQVITSISSRPIRIGSRYFMAVGVGNKNDGIDTSNGCGGAACTSIYQLKYSGEIFLIELSPTGGMGTPMLIARHNSPAVVGLEGVGAGLAVAGRVTVQLIPPDYLSAFINDGPKPEPILLQLDEVLGTEGGALRYADGFEVLHDAIHNQSPQQSQTLNSLGGIGVWPIDDMNFYLVLTNQRTTATGFVRDASITWLANGGYVPRAIASLQKSTSGNLNEAFPRARYVTANQNLGFTMIPPGGLLGGSRTNPWLRNDLPPEPGIQIISHRSYYRPMDAKAWLNIIRELKGKKGPLPGPDDAPPIPAAGGSQNPGNCRSNCVLPCNYPGDYHNPLSQGPADAGWATAPTEGAQYCSATPTPIGAEVIPTPVQPQVYNFMTYWYPGPAMIGTDATLPETAIDKYYGDNACAVDTNLCGVVFPTPTPNDGGDGSLDGGDGPLPVGPQGLH